MSPLKMIKMCVLAMVLASLGGNAYARFMGVDPSPPDPNNIHSFNRYAYGNNNPYKFIDPDGRRSEVINGRINISPENRSVPAVTLPNNVGAQGVVPSDTFFHTYNVETPSKIIDAAAIGQGIENRPTPGPDNKPASPLGTINNAGPLPTMGDVNLVRSYLIKSPDATRYTDITVNYTISGAHGLDEGFVVRFGQISPTNGSITLRSYGEGNNWHQAPALQRFWGPVNDGVWQLNQNAIINSVQ